MAIPTLIGVSMLIFILLRVMPGDVLAVMFGQGEAMTIIDQEAREALLRDLHLDKPLYFQYLLWLKDIATGKLGTSWWVKTPVAEVIARRGPLSLEIALFSFMLAWLIGLPLGIISATRQNTTADYVGRVVTVFLLAAPTFWIGAVVILILILFLQWFPPMTYTPLWVDPIANLKMVALPAAILSLHQGAMIARMTRSTFLEVLREDYIRTARAKGLGERVVQWRHVMRNALIPVLTLSAVALCFLLGGSVAIERLFNLPGLGLTLVEAVQDRDFVVIQNLVLLYAGIFVIINLLVDLTYGLIDPRIRYE
jgi:peptide/nickel transport system permease protein